MKFQKLSLVVVLAAAWGCAGKDAVNIGDDRQTPKAKTGELLSDYAASWDGYTEAYKFGSGSDRLRIELDDEGNGTVVLGDGAPPAPATDPDARYDPYGFRPPMEGPPTSTLGEGFAYTVQHAEVHDKRIRFGIDGYEVYKSWCELQVPVHDTTGDPNAPEYGCIPYHTSAGSNGTTCHYDDYVTGEEVEASCVRIDYCSASPVCTCTADGCTVAPLTSADATPYVLDAVLDDNGDSLVGTMTLSGHLTVRMERQ